MQAASAWVAASEGKKSDAIELLRKAADAEDILGKHPVSPGAFVPIREQLGFLLLDAERTKRSRARVRSRAEDLSGAVSRVVWGGNGGRAIWRQGEREAILREVVRANDQV